MPSIDQEACAGIRGELNEPKRICFVSIEAYATLKPGVAEIAGGAGFQVVQLGRRLSKHGHAISFVVGDFGQPFRDVVDGFPTYRASRVSGGSEPTRGFANVMRVFRAMRAARARHYVMRSNRNLSFFVLVSARLLGARFSFMVANPLHVTRQGLEGMSGVTRFLYSWTLRHADLVTVQTEEQKRLLLDNYGVQGVLVPNGIAIPPLSEAPPKKSHDVVWVGSIKPLKRPDRLLAIARSLPERRFLVAGGPGSDRAHDRAYYDETVAAFASQPNLIYSGFVPPHQVEEIYRSGRLCLLTSDYEGFPNAFLHAWANAVPVCSLGVDPDGVIAAHGLGLVDTRPQSLARRIDALLNDQAAYEAMCVRCYEHVRRSHSAERMEAALLEALPGR
jgi:glycosyltransferase involved in cell wall biosynthesis